MKKFLLILLIQFVWGVTFAQVEEVTSCGSTVKKEMQQGDIYDYVDEPAEFPGGMAALRQFLADNLKYPERPLKDSIEGKCYVKLLITDQGVVQNVKVTKGVPDYPEFDAEALRVMSLMPKWKPGRVNGKNVSSYYRIPVTFRLNQIK
jgi:protein TonB